jgi:hypothetical protein
MGQKLKLAVLLSSFAVSGAVLAQSTQPSQATGANVPARPTQLAQGQGAAGAVGGQATGAAATASGAAASAGGIGAAMGVPGAIAAGMTAVGAAGTSDNGSVQTTTSH